MSFYLGILSGTSCDAIDAVLVDFKSIPLKIIATYSTPMPEEIKLAVRSMSEEGKGDIQSLGILDRKIGLLFAETIESLLKDAGVARSQVCAIGSHGQNVYHHPDEPNPFTLQIGDPHLIAKKTGILTVADFRRSDMALGGQGAPLVPRFHQAVFQDLHEPRMVLNIGGIANLTYLPAKHAVSQHVLGFDTGPGNALLDAWIMRHQQKPFDNKGAWAQKGHVLPALLNKLSLAPYFHRPAPKSTGKETFNLGWVDKHCEQNYNPEDVQATLATLTIQTIQEAIQQHMSHGKVLLCGGGAKNYYLVDGLQAALGSDFTLGTTTEFGIPSEWVEALCFAWLAKARLENQPGNLPRVTGASREAVLGAVYAA
jgi:anhydro-N-acetylmuramic acid kinase